MAYQRVLRFLLVVGPALAPAAGRAQQAPPPKEPFPAELDRYIAAVLAEWKIPGLAVAVVRNDSVLVAKGYGVRELGKPDPVDEHTAFDAASLSKAFTATAAAVLVDRGVLHWDDPVRRHLPDLVLPTPELTATATVRDFLSHRTGLESANMMWVLTAVDRAEVLRRVRHLRVVAPFRQSWTYNNVGYTVAGEAIARAAGTTIEDLLRDLVIRPLGLRSTTWSYAQAATLPNVASPHATVGGRQQPIRRETQRHAVEAAAAVHSSASDLAQWMRLHLNHGVLDGRRVVSDSAMREMHSKQVTIATTPAMRAARLVEDTMPGYGLGWQIMDYRGHPIHWHTGNGDGQIAWLALLPRDRLGVVVLVNTWSAPFVHMALINRTLDTYLGYEPRDWAAEALARVPAMDRARDSVARVMEAMKSAAPPPLPPAAYAGTYQHPLFGPVHVRTEGSRLSLRMGDGQEADLEYHGGDTFYTRWRDPLYRENFGAHVEFARAGDSVVSLSTRINRDEFTAVRSDAAAAVGADPVWRPSWPGTEIAVISGDLLAGPFVFRFRMPGGYWICPHTHPIPARLRTISGTFLVGMGTALDTSTVRVLEAGGEIAVEAGMAHFEGTRGETVVEVRGTGPWGITFLDPRYHPASGGMACRP
jgi:CubicO group peptidase (beta-lactamase class C family)